MQEKNKNYSYTELNHHDRKILDKYTRTYINLNEVRSDKQDTIEEKSFNISNEVQ